MGQPPQANTLAGGQKPGLVKGFPRELFRHSKGYKAFPCSQCAPESLPVCLKSEAGEEDISSALCAKENAGISVRKTGKRERQQERASRKTVTCQL